MNCLSLFSCQNTFVSNFKVALNILFSRFSYKDMIVTQLPNNGPCPQDVTNYFSHVFASSSFKSKAFFVFVYRIRCNIYVAFYASNHMGYYVSSLSCTYLLDDINISHVQKKAAFFLLFRYSQIIEISHRDVINQYTQLVYITYSHQRYTHI